MVYLAPRWPSRVTRPGLPSIRPPFALNTTFAPSLSTYCAVNVTLSFAPETT